MCSSEPHPVAADDESKLGIFRGRTRLRPLLPLLGGDAARMLEGPSRFIERSREGVEQLSELRELQRVVPYWDARLRQDAPARVQFLVALEVSGVDLVLVRRVAVGRPNIATAGASLENGARYSDSTICCCPRPDVDGGVDVRGSGPDPVDRPRGSEDKLFLQHPGQMCEIIAQDPSPKRQLSGDGPTQPDGCCPARRCRQRTFALRTELGLRVESFRSTG